VSPVRLQLLCVSKRPAGWVDTGCQEYLKRLQGRLDLQVRELPPATGAASAEQQKQREAAAIFKALNPLATLVALDERGAGWSTRDLAGHLAGWLEAGREVVLVIGGAEGLAEPVRAAAARVWSLSPLTLPHQLARVVVIEQIYRAWSLLNHHPYHRE
jgi:23S rRNA (pseudouridine1915-N3)-methyltransferase